MKRYVAKTHRLRHCERLRNVRGRMPVIRAGMAALCLAYAAGAETAASPADETPPPVVSVTSASHAELAADASLRDYVRYALTENPGLRAAHARWQAAMERIPQVTSLPDPRLSYAFYLKQVETRVGPQRQKLTLAQMVPWFGKRRLRGDIEATKATALWFDFQARQLRLVYRVRMLYHDLYYLKQAIDITRENFDLLKRLEVVARERYRTGKALTGVMQAQVELGKLEEQLGSLENVRPALTAKLNAALNRGQAMDIPWPSILPETPGNLDRSVVMARIRQRNPELRRLTALAEKERLAQELARKNGFPDFTLGVTVIDTETASMSGVRDNGKDPVIASISMNLPIWRSKYRAQYREAVLRGGAATAGEDERGDDLAADAALALYYYEDAGRKIRLYRDSLLPKARQSLGVAQRAFQAGNVTFITLVDAQRVLLEFQLALERARTERGKRYAELRMLAGD